METRKILMDKKLLKEAKSQLLELRESLDEIKIVAYSFYYDHPDDTEFLVIDTSTMPEGLDGDYSPCFFLLFHQDTEWELGLTMETEELMDWMLDDRKKAIIPVSDEFYFLESELLQEIEKQAPYLFE